MFFVISSIALAMPALGKREFDWIGCHPARVVRLFIPLAASVALAIGWPIIVAMSALFGLSAFALIAALTIVISTVASELFARFVELPAHRLSKRVGAASSTRFRELTH